MRSSRMADDPSLTRVWDALTGYQRTAAFKAAVELDVFTAIGEGVDTDAALAARCGAAARGIRALCDHLVVQGFVTRAGGRYGLTPTAAAFLDRRSPSYVASAATFLTSPTIMDAFARLTDAVRRGGTAVPESGTLAPEHPVWVEFARAMAPLAGLTGALVANQLDADAGRPWTVLDVAAGHGMFGIAIAQRNPNARIAALDWGNVLAVARENAAKAGVGDRFRTIAGSAFDVDWGTGYDLVLFPNFLHHFDEAGCETLLRAHAALAPGGRVVIVEFVPDEDRQGPPEALSFSLVMLASTPAGDAYTFAAYRRMLEHTGFADAAVQPIPPAPHQVVIGRRP